MLFAAIYLALLLSNWGRPTINNNLYPAFSAGSTAVNIKLGTCWATMVLYIWTIVAPRLFPDRDFS